MTYKIELSENNKEYVLISDSFKQYEAELFVKGKIDFESLYLLSFRLLENTTGPIASHKYIKFVPCEKLNHADKKITFLKKQLDSYRSKCHELREINKSLKETVEFFKKIEYLPE